MNNNVLNSFLELIKIDSPSGEESEIREFLVNKLNNLGISSFVDKTGNLFAKTEGIGEPVILSAHIDTVEPGRKIKSEVSGGYVKSDGTTILGADNKSTLSAILCAIDLVPIQKRRPLEILFSVREETDGGINKFDFSQLKSKTGIVSDASFPVGTIILSSPWIQEIKIEVIGKAAHAGYPEAGINALTAAGKSLAGLTWGRIDDKTTSNIGLIHGGSATNTIPERVFLEGEIRSFSESIFKKRIGLIKKVFATQSEKSDTKLVFGSELYCTGYSFDKKDKAVSIAEKAIRKSGLIPRFGISFGGSDANAFNAKGIKVVNLGDGTEDSHTVNEKISVQSLNRLVKIICNYITVN
jgi:tripeptide aminopeptidase